MRRSRIGFMVLGAVALALLMQTALAQPAQQSQTQSGCGLLPSYVANEISSSQPWYCPINQELYTQWQGYLPIASVAVLIAFLIGSMIFMVGMAFKSDRIRDFGIGEVYEAMASGIVVGAFLYISAVMFGILPGSLVGAINPYATAFNQIQTTIQSAQYTFTQLFNLYLPIQFTTSISQSIKIAGSAGLGGSIANAASEAINVGVKYGLFPLTIFWVDPANVIAGFLADGIVLLYSEYYLMIFLATSAIPVFLAPGVVFRALAPTRALGGMMIAIALAFFIVVPSLFAIVYYFTGPTLQQQLNIAAAQAGKFSASSINSQLGTLGPTSPLVVQLQNVQQAMSSFWLQIIFYPLLIISMTYAFITQAANFLGSTAKAMGGKIRGFI